MAGVISSLTVWLLAWDVWFYGALDGYWHQILISRDLDEDASVVDGDGHGDGYLIGLDWEVAMKYMWFYTQRPFIYYSREMQLLKGCFVTI